MKIRPAGWLLIIVLAALALRLWRLGEESFWVDEVLTAIRAERPLTHVLIEMRRNNHPPLYYFAARPMAACLGLSEWTLRLPSALFGAASAACMYFLAAGFFPCRKRTIPLLLALFMALCPYQVYFGQEARAYSLIACLACLHMLALYRLLFAGDAPRTSSDAPPPETAGGAPARWMSSRHAAWALFVVTGACGWYSHFVFGTFFFAGMAVAAMSFALPAWRSRVVSGALRLWLRAVIAVGLLFMPWFFYAPEQIGHLPGYRQAVMPVLSAWETTLRTFRPLTAMQSPYDSAAWFDVIWMWLLVFTAASTTWYFWKKRQVAPQEAAAKGWKAGWVAAWFAIIWAIYLSISASGEVFLFERYFMVLTPPLYLLLGWILAAVPALHLRMAAAAWIAAFAAFLACVYYPLPQKTPWREITEQVSSRVTHKQHVRVSDPLAIAPLQYYDRPRRGILPFHGWTFPPGAKHETPWELQVRVMQPESSVSFDALKDKNYREVERLPVADFVDLVRYERIPEGDSAAPAVE